MSQLFLPNLSGVLEAISGRLMNFFHIDWGFFCGELIFSFFRFFCLGWEGYEYWDCWIGPLDALSAFCTKWSLLWVLPVLLRGLFSLLWKTCKYWNCSTSQSNLFCSLTESRQLKVLTDWLCWNFSPNAALFFYFTSGLFPDKALEIHYLFALCACKSCSLCLSWLLACCFPSALVNYFSILIFSSQWDWLFSTWVLGCLRNVSLPLLQVQFSYVLFWGLDFWMSGVWTVAPIPSCLWWIRRIRTWAHVCSWSFSGFFFCMDTSMSLRILNN